MDTSSLSAADAVWIATASMHKQHPRRPAFAVSEIVEEATQQHLFRGKIPTIYLHANQHCVANRPPNKARLCMLVETPDGMRRLYHDGDPIDPRRVGARHLPDPETLPAKFRNLLAWYRDWNSKYGKQVSSVDPLAALAGTWTFGSATQYLRDLRQGW